MAKESGPKVESANLQSGLIEATLSTGARLCLHPDWLRDNCSCDACIHPSTQERTFDLLCTSGAPSIEHLDLSPDGALIVHWKGGHNSRFESDWILHHRPGFSRASARLRDQRPWDARLSIPRFSLGTVMETKLGLRAWLEALIETGLTILEGLPKKTGVVEVVTERFGHVRPSNFGRVFTVMSKPDPVNQAYTAAALPPHTDLPNWASPPSFQLLHCIENESGGGESIFVDGAKSMEVLKSESARMFELITSFPLEFRYRDQDVDIRHRAPAAIIDEQGQLAVLRHNNGLLAPIDAQPEQMGEIYQAHRLLTEIVRRREHQARFVLQPGELVAFDNRRVLHGRSAFDPSLGLRHLEGCYADWEEVTGRLRALDNGIRSMMRSSGL